ncbi:unnamed protein product [Schistocephalus solidus]|uniref:SAM domain-containing protein n=1 Tax=Schistocephalus solidus TaxID=70667 RepID=A0A3P7C474_SCHSO|nr:unnamed protein product [Schistocephalus solidus]
MAYWTTIFTDAGLPHGISQKYAHLFVENRMTTKLLPFLDKDLLKEIGITAVGDIIAILQHCKKVKHEVSQGFLKESDSDVKKPKLLPGKYTLSSLPRIGHELPVPEKRTVSREIEGAYKVKLPQGTTEKTRRILQQVKLGKWFCHFHLCDVASIFMVCTYSSLLLISSINLNLKVCHENIICK